MVNTPLTTIILLDHNFIVNFVSILGICKDYKLGKAFRCGIVPKFSDHEVSALGISLSFWF